MALIRFVSSLTQPAAVLVPTREFAIFLPDQRLRKSNILVLRFGKTGIYIEEYDLFICKSFCPVAEIKQGCRRQDEPRSRPSSVLFISLFSSLAQRSDGG